MLDITAIVARFRKAGRQIDSFLENTVGMRHRGMRRGAELGVAVGLVQGFMSAKGHNMGRIRGAIYAAVAGAVIFGALGRLLAKP